MIDERLNMTRTKNDMKRHTPGPWHVGEKVDKPHHYDLVGFGNGATHVGYISVTPATAPEAEANATLIAAAPEMLEALKKCKDFLEFLCVPRDAKHEDAYKSLTYSGKWGECMLSARAALKKAQDG